MGELIRIGVGVLIFGAGIVTGYVLGNSSKMEKDIQGIKERLDDLIIEEPVDAPVEESKED